MLILNTITFTCYFISSPYKMGPYDLEPMHWIEYGMYLEMPHEIM